MLSFTTNGNFIDFKYTEDQYPFYVHLLMSLHNTSRCIDWSLPDDATRITFTIDEYKYEGILISGIEFDGVAMSAQADFAVGIKAMFPGYAGSFDENGFIMVTSDNTSARITLTKDGGGNLQLTITEI